MDNKISGYGREQSGQALSREVDPALPEDREYREVVGILYEKLEEIKEHFIVIGWCLNHIKKNGWYLKEGCRDIYQFAECKFHLSQPTASRFMALCREFSAGNDSAELDMKYKDFSYSQLSEMLPMDPEQRQEVTPGMTVREIRSMKKEWRLQTLEAISEGKHAPVGQGDTVYATSHMDNAAGKDGGQSRRLLGFHNGKERRAWIEDVEAWGLWYEDEKIGARYYKYDFPDGSRLTAVKYRCTCPPFMKGNPTKYRDQIEADGSYYGEATYRMAFSEWYWDRHGDECRKYFEHPTIGISALAEFLKEIPDWEREESDNSEEAYVSNEYILKEFDPDHPEGAETYAGKRYARFYKRNGYIPKFFNAKSCKEVKHSAPTLATGCGGSGSIGSILFFDACNEIEFLVNDKGLDLEEAYRMVSKVLRVAEPGERKKAEELLETGRMGGYGSA